MTEQEMKNLEAMREKISCKYSKPEIMSETSLEVSGACTLCW